MRVWGISYKLRDYPKSKWCGPCGIFFMTFSKGLDRFIIDGFIGRPIFFRTRKLARKEAKMHTDASKRIMCKVEPFELKWKNK